MAHDRGFTKRATETRRARGRKTSVTIGRSATLHERFDVKVTETDGCWLWIGATYDQGYGMFRVADGKTVRAHRFAYERWVGPIPTGMTIDHTCEVKACVNPAHLDPVSDAENRRRYHLRRGHVVAA